MISKVVTKAVSYIEKGTGFYTKKGCVRAATAVGKDLADIQKVGKNVTADDIYAIMSREVPHVKKPNIAFGKEELAELLRKSNLNELEQRFIFHELYLNGSTSKHVKGIFNSGFEGIFVKTDLPKMGIPTIIAHELEHYMEFYSNPRTRIRSFFEKLKPSYRKGKLAYETRMAKILNSPDKDKLIEQEISRRVANGPRVPSYGVQIDLTDGLGLKEALMQDELKKYGSSEEDVLKFLKSDIFVGLSNEKRIDAYLRGILRHYIHPKTNPSCYRRLRNSLKGEINAYQVSDNVMRYEGSDILTAAKVRTSLYKRLINIIDKEKLIAIFGKGKGPKYRPGLPIPAISKDIAIK
jgi:hypothetical protein